MATMLPMKHCQFCAHDEHETSLRFVTFNNLDGTINRQCWVLTDERGMSIDFKCIHDALVNMSIITATDMSDFTILNTKEYDGYVK